MRSSFGRRLRPGRTSPSNRTSLARQAQVLFELQRSPHRDAVRLIKAVTAGRRRSTLGGTSSTPRFIKDYSPVVEFGLVGQTMHMVDERVSLADLEALTRIYERFLQDWFG